MCSLDALEKIGTFNISVLKVIPVHFSPFVMLNMLHGSPADSCTVGLPCISVGMRHHL